MNFFVLTAALTLSSFSVGELLQLALDFTFFDNTGRIRVCNFVNCWGQGNLYLTKQLSNGFRCAVAVNPPNRPLSEWFVDLQLQLFVVDLGCPHTREFLKQAEGLGLFNGNFVWLLVDSREEVNDTRLVTGRGSAPSALQELDVTVSSQVNVATRVSDDRYEITGYYRRDTTDPLIQEPLGYWKADEGLVFTAVRCPAVRRQNLGRRLFRASMVITNDNSLNHIYDLVDVHIDIISKINYVFFDLVLDAMNATAIHSIARKWGSNASGTFDGMMGHITSNRSEVLITSLLMSHDRMEIVDYVAYTMSIPAYFIFLSPPLSYKNNIYLLPFDTNAWVSIVAFFVVFGVTSYVAVAFEQWEPLTEDEVRHMVKKPLTRKWSDVILLNWGTVCQQDIFIEPRGAVGKITMLFLKIIVLFLYVYYSAAILVLLQSSDRSITTLSDLYKSNLRFGSHDTPYNRFYLTHPTNPTQAAIVSKLRDFMSLEKGVQMIRSGLFAFQVDKSIGYATVQKVFDKSEMCRLQELKESYLSNMDTMVAVKKHSPYSEVLAIMYGRINEFGMMHREKLRKTAKKPPCPENLMFFISVGLIDTEAAFLVLAAGVLGSICILFTEICVFRCLKRYRKKSSPPHYEFCH